MAVNNWYTVQEASEILGVTAKTIYRNIKKGKYTARKDGTGYFIQIKTRQTTTNTPNEEKTQQRATEDATTDRKSADTQSSDLFSALLKQLDTKDKQIESLNMRLYETNSLLNRFQNLLPAPKVDASTGEVITDLRADIPENKKKKESFSRSLTWIVLGVVISGLAGSILYFLGVIRF